MIWTLLHPSMTADHLGFLPSFLSEADDRPAAAQIDAHYQHGGGWRGSQTMSKWKLLGPWATAVLKYPGDPPLRPLAVTQLREEKIYFYDHAIVMILQPDGSFEVSRVD